MIVLVDVTASDDLLMQLLDRLGWWERLTDLGQALLWTRPGQVRPSDLPACDRWEQIVAHGRKLGATRVILVQADQLFLDPGVVQSGLAAQPEEWDYFTQWEHSRLPVGVGVRAVSLGHEKVAAWDGSPEELVRHIQTHPDEYRMRYDANLHVPYPQAMLDSRYASTRKVDWLGLAKRGAASLQDFRQSAAEYDYARFAYQAPTHTGPIDERGMPAAFGFESRACAAFPTYVMFDVTNLCNSKCTHCPHSLPDYHKKHPVTHLDPDVFRRVVDECVGRELQFVRITADGEPLLHPQLLEMIAYATQHGVGPIGLTTNGSLLTPEVADQLIDAGLFMVDFSLDAVRRDTYAEIRRGLDYDTVMQNVTAFVARRNERRAPIKVMVSFVKQRRNIDELDEFRARWEGVVDKVLIRELISNINMVDDESEERAPVIKRWPCTHYFRRIVIACQGKIKACPVDWDDRTAVGDARQLSIFDTWHGETYWRTRMEHLNQSFVAGSACRECQDWMGSPWSLGYEKVVQSLNA